MNKYEAMAKAHTFKELGEQFLATNDLQLLGGMNFIMSKTDSTWKTKDCYQCRRDLATLQCAVDLVQLANGDSVFCCTPCRELTTEVNTRRIELLDAMKRNK